MKRNYILLLLCMVCCHFYGQTVAINEVTLGGVNTSAYQSAPADPDYAYTYSQSIYLQAEIAQEGEIYKITYFVDPSWDASTLENTNEVVVYMGKTPQSTFASSTDWIPDGDLSEVFSGTVQKFGSKVEIVLDTPYSYNNNDNLVIAFDENNPGVDNAKGFICHNLTTANKRVNYIRSNTDNPDPAALTAGTNAHYRANIELDFTPIDCKPPTSIIVSNIQENSVELNWDTSASISEYVFQPLGTGNPDGGAIVNVGAATNETLFDLTFNTGYEVYLRSDCGVADGLSEWVGPVEFRTACGIEGDIMEDFEGYPDGFPQPFCWSALQSTTGSVAPTLEVSYSETQAYSGDNYFEIKASDDDTAYFIAPESSTLSDGAHRVEFAAKVGSFTGGNAPELKVGLMSDPSDESSFLELSAFSLSSSSTDATGYTVYYLNVPFSETHNNLAFKAEANSSTSKTFYLDDITIVSQPACHQVLGIGASNITDVSFDLNFITDFQTQTEWQVIAKPTLEIVNLDLETPLTVNANEISLTTDTDGNAIESSVGYSVFVKANCDATGSDGSGESDWFGPYQFTSACASLTANYLETFDTYSDGDFPDCWNVYVESSGTPFVEINTSTNAFYYASASNAFIMNTGNDPDATIILSMPPFAGVTDGGHRVEFKVKTTIATVTTDLIVGTMSDPLNPETFEEIETITHPIGAYNAPFISYFVNIPYNVDGDAYISFKHGAGIAFGSSIYMDDIAITNQPGCVEIFNLEAWHPSANTIDLSWQYINEQTAWDYSIVPEGEDPGATVTVSSNELTNVEGDLEADTFYDVYVRANCGEGEYSAWVGPVTFKTECEPYDTAYIEDFQDETTGVENLQSCWSVLTLPEGSLNNYEHVTGYGVETVGPICTKISGVISNAVGYPTDLFFISPRFNDISTNKEVIFSVYNDSDVDEDSADPNDSAMVQVGTMSDPADASTFHLLETYDVNDIAAEDTWYEFILNFTEFTNEGDSYVAFRVIPATTNLNKIFYFDNFTYQVNGTLSVEDIDFEGEITIYPNPVNEGVLNIKGENILEANVYNLKGQKIIHSNINSDKIDVSKISNGVYFIDIITNQGTSIKKRFIKQ